MGRQARIEDSAEARVVTPDFGTSTRSRIAEAVQIVPQAAKAPAERWGARSRHTHLQLFGHRIRTTKVLHALADFASFFAISVVALGLFGPGVADATLFATALVAAASFQLGLLALGLYEHREREGSSGLALRALIATCAIAPAAFAVVDTLLPGQWVATLGFAASALGAFSLTVLGRLLAERAGGEPLFRRRVLVIGVGREAARINARMRRRSDRAAFEIAGYVNLGERDQVGQDDPSPRFPLGDRPLRELCADLSIDEVVIALDDRRGGGSGSLPIQALLECKMAGIETVELPDFFEREAGRIDIDILRPSWLLFAEGFAQPARRTFKRVFDVLMSATMLAMTWPLLLLTIVAIKLEEGIRAPVFYRQSRTGYGGRSFDVLKFRSMRVDAEKFGKAVFAEENDPRITRIGRFIRRTRIDELPQLLNILRGDMSVVGPRPERPCFVDRFCEEIPFYGERHRVKPGLAGWAQLNYPYGAGAEDARRKLEFDLYYVKNYSMLLDLMILIRTAEVVLLGKGVR